MQAEITPQHVRTSSFAEDSDGIVGVCVLGDLVYVVRSWSTKVEVFSSSLSSVKRLIAVSGLDLPYDMTGCPVHNCLYLTDYGSDVHRVEVGIGGLQSKWPAGDGSMTVSVTGSTNSVIVTYQATPKVIA